MPFITTKRYLWWWCNWIVRSLSMVVSCLMNTSIN